MSLRYFWIISLNLRSVLYFRRFPNVEKTAKRLGLKDIELSGDDQLINSLMTSLAISATKSNDKEFSCTHTNQLPVIDVHYKDTHLWPVLVIEQNGVLFCGYPLCPMNDNDKDIANELIDQKSIALSFTFLQTIARHFTSDKDLSWIEWLVLSMSPFGTLVNQNYDTLDKSNAKKVSKLETKLQNDCLKLIINELVSRNRDKELVFGTLQTDKSDCGQSLSDDSLLTLKLRDVKSLNLVLPPNSALIGPNIQIQPSLQNPLHSIHYKCNSDNKKTFLSYNYQLIDIRNDNNLYRIELTLTLKNSIQFKFSYFNVYFKHKSANNSCLNPINSNVTFGQLRHETIGLFWVIGTRFPKSGQIKLTFEVNWLNKKLQSDIETFCNFKVDNFQTCLLYVDSHHLCIDDMSLDTEMPVIIDSNLTSIDYKLFPEIT